MMRRAFGLLSLALTAAAWFFLGPQSIGGPVVYTVITGQSMEPLLHADDLVLVREDPPYGIGDAVAYRSANLRQTVLHRIVARDGERFVMKGDNNDFLDGDQPSEDEIIGKLWVDIPRAGVAFAYLRSPVGMALAGVAILAILGVFSVNERRRARGSRHRRTVPGPNGSEPTAPELRPRSDVRSTAGHKRRSLQIVAVVLALLFLASCALGVLAFTWPALREAPRTIVYEHTGTFAYSAPSPEGPVYEESQITAGDPVFLQLVENLNVSFDYSLEPQLDADVALTGDMDAVVASDNGWRRTIELASAGASEGGRLELTGQLDLARIRALLRSVENLTGMAPGSYAVSIEPEIQVEGTIEGQDVSDTFSPRLGFELDEIQLTLARPEEGGVSQDLEQLLQPRREESLEVQGLVPNPLTVGGRELPLDAVKQFAVGAAGLMLVALLTVSIVMLRRRPRSEVARIQARHGSLLIPVTEGPALRQETVDVNDIDTLARLAQQFEQPIMHQETGSGFHRYMLYYDGLVYRYTIPESDEEFSPPPQVDVHKASARSSLVEGSTTTDPEEPSEADQSEIPR